MLLGYIASACLFTESEAEAARAATEQRRLGLPPFGRLAAIIVWAMPFRLGTD